MTEVGNRLLFQEQLYYTKGQVPVPKRRRVTLKEKRVADSFSFFKLADVQFQQEELCFLESDELEIKVPSPVQHFCGNPHKQWQRKLFHSLCVLTCDTQHNTSTVQKFYEESYKSDAYVTKIAVLKRKLESLLGPCFSWFVDKVVDERFSPSDKLRLLLTSQNLCLVNHKLEILYFLQLSRNNPDITVAYNDDNSVLEIASRQPCVWSIDFHTVNCMRVKTGLGEEIKMKVEGVLMGRLPAPSRVLSWIIDNIDVPSEEDEEDSEEPPSPHLPHLLMFREAEENDDRNEYPAPVPPRVKRLVRSESMNDMYLTPTTSYKNYVYVNEEYRKAHSKSAHEDGSYNSIYYCNIGWVPGHYPSSLFRNSRRSRLSSEFGDVDVTAMKNHEQWFDKGFKRRSMDKIYTRLGENSTQPKEVWSPDDQCGQLNIPVDDESSCESGDDIYWNTKMCVCIHAAFESKLRKSDLMATLDVTWEQLLALFIHLDVNTLHIRAKDWKDFAALLKLNFRDIEILQHFCYTYREWPMFILLSYWMLLSKQSRRAVPVCCHDELINMLEILGRRDLLKILTTRNTNQHIQVAQETEDTYL
ncbi:uncharacterized protein [Argopecten irradians]|uniref:uncharacterized protein n=1 Tax=Argopecten irradians TaxID=31199 RepID=UPI00371675AB